MWKMRFFPRRLDSLLSMNLQVLRVGSLPNDKAPVALADSLCELERIVRPYSIDAMNVDLEKQGTFLIPSTRACYSAVGTFSFWDT